MGRKPLPKNRTLDPQLRQEWLNVLIPYFLQNGFHGVTSNDIAQHLGISKATLYEHFSSRDEIFEQAVESLISKVRANRTVLEDEKLTHRERFIHLFGMILRQIMGVSTVLLNDLEVHYPHLWHRVMDFFLEWYEILQGFFRKGIDAGEFSKVHPAISGLMVTSFLRELFNPEFLIKHELDMNQVFADFLRLMTGGVFATLPEEEARSYEELFWKVVEEALADVAAKTNAPKD